MSTVLVHSLQSLGHWLASQGYRFVTPTPATHQRVNTRHANSATNLRDVFGWSRPFTEDMLDSRALGWLRDADLLEVAGENFCSRVRFSSIGEHLYAHSAYPTTDANAIFFGPDTYRFANLVAAELQARSLVPGARILDVCCGGGPGGIEAAICSKPAETGFADINETALDFARANAGLAGLGGAAFFQGDLFNPTDGLFDLVIANPPYLVDPARRVYRNGGGERGAGLSERIVLEGLTKLAPGGRLILYTGVAIIEGVDPFHKKISQFLQEKGAHFSYREIDPDVFGEELETPGYADAERIAAVGLVVHSNSRNSP